MPVNKQSNTDNLYYIFCKDEETDRNFVYTNAFNRFCVKDKYRQKYNIFEAKSIIEKEKDSDNLFNNNYNYYVKNALKYDKNLK